MLNLGLVGCGSFQHGSSALQLLGKSGTTRRQHMPVLLPLHTKPASPAAGVWAGSKAIGGSRQWLDLQQQLSAESGDGSAGRGVVRSLMLLQSPYPAAVLPAFAELPVLEVIGCDSVAAAAATVMSAAGADQPAWPSSDVAGAAAGDGGWSLEAEVTGLVLSSIGWWLLVWCACVQAAAQQLLHVLQELVVHLLLQGELSLSGCVLTADP